MTVGNAGPCGGRWSVRGVRAPPGVHAGDGRTRCEAGLRGRGAGTLPEKHERPRFLMRIRAQASGPSADLHREPRGPRPQPAGSSPRTPSCRTPPLCAGQPGACSFPSFCFPSLCRSGLRTRVQIQASTNSGPPTFGKLPKAPEARVPYLWTSVLVCTPRGCWESKCVNTAASPAQRLEKPRPPQHAATNR